MRCAITVAALLVGTAASAQNTTAPTTTTLPAPGVERFSLPPGNSQSPAPTPSPTPTPAATLTPSPPPSVIPTLGTPPRAPDAQPTRVAPTTRPTPTPTRAAPPASEPPVERTTDPTSAPAISPAPPPTDSATPTPVETLLPPVAATTSGPPTWLWWALGLVLILAAAAFGWRRLAGARGEPVDDAPQPVAPDPAVPTPSPPAKPVTAAAPQAAPALAIEFRPQRLWTRGPDAYLAFELLVTNTTAAPIDSVRPVIALVSAGPDTAADIAAFGASAPSLPGGEPFDLRAGETRSVAGELTLPGDAMYVTSAAERELIVPVALVGLAWRNGLSLARNTEAFVIGTGDAGAPRLGPIWVDRAGLVYPKLDARRFTT